jgi:restriction endonuclease S subunit
MRKDWTETTLNEIAEVNMGQSPPGSSYNSEGIGLPFMQGSAEFGEHNPTPVKWCTSPAKIAEIGDLLLSVRAPVGDTNIANQRIAIGRGLATIRGGKESNTGFLRLLVQKNTAELIANSGTGMFSSITGKNLKEFKILMPPLAEQKRIVDVVSSVDAYIDALQQQADTARTARNAVLHDLLSAGGDGWTETTLGELCEIYQPETISKAQMDDAAQYIVYGANGPVGRFSRFNHSEPEVVVTCRGATCGVVNMTPANCWITGNAMVVKPRDDRSTKGFLFWALQTSVDVQATISGSAQPQITRAGLAPSKIQVPPLAEQKQIVEIVSAMDEVIQSTEKAVIDAKALRSGLLSDLLSGNHEIPASYDSLLGVA